jgi:menaquinol-cytochrome c reductase iron-sulfur subunit
MANETDEGRRSVLKLIGGACGAAAAAAVGVPVVGAVIAPAAKDTVTGAGDFVPTVAFDAVPKDGSPIVVAVVVQAPKDAWSVMPPTEIGSIFLKRSESGDPIAYSTVCPHLGCQVDLDHAGRRFRCPCHDSEFSTSGEVRGGPSPRSLDVLATRVVDGRVEVRYQRFKTGTHEKIPI